MAITVTHLLPARTTTLSVHADNKVVHSHNVLGRLPNGYLKTSEFGDDNKRKKKDKIVPNVEDLGPVTSGLQFEPCRFPVASNDNTTGGHEIPEYKILPVFSLCNKVFGVKLDHEQAADSNLLIRTAWALLIHNYTQTEIVSFAHTTAKNSEETDSDFIASIVARFSLEESSSQSLRGPREMSERTVSTHVLQEGQLNTAVHFLRGSTWSGEDYPFDLVLLVEKTSYNMHLTLAFKLSSVSNKYGKAIAHTLKHILSTLTSDKIEPPSSLLSLTSPADTGTINRLNSVTPFQTRACLHDLVEQSYLKLPSKEAVCAWNGTFTYEELWNHSTYWTQQLKASGVQNGMLIPICFEKSRWAIVAMLSILRAGAAIVPLDPDHPTTRLRHLCSAVGAKMILSSSKNERKVEGLVDQVIVISAVSYDYMSAKIEIEPSVISTPFDAAFVLFTSGSTGRPKAIVQEHRSAATHSMAHGRQMGYQGQRTLQFSAFTWDVAMIDIFTTLIFGGCVCVPSEADRKLDITGAINRMGVELAFLTPSFASLIDPNTTPGLRTLVVAGEALKQNVVRQWVNHVQLYQGYGPAEVGVCNIARVSSTESPAENVGLPANSLCFIVDPSNHNKLMPIGATGELVVGGPTLARGYHDDPANNSTAFFKNPPWAKHLPRRFQRFYKTGDLLKYNSQLMDGSMDFVGRIGSQIKRHGQRVEVGEIEYHVSNMSAVGIAVVAQPKNGCYKGELIAVVQLAGQKSGQISRSSDDPIRFVATSSSGLNQASLTKHLSDYVPRYMIPNVLLIVENMPFSASLKVETKMVHAWLEGLSTRYYDTSGSQTSQLELSSSKLRSDEEVAHTVNAKIADLLAKDDSNYRERLLGTNFNLQEAGVTSIHIISLSLFLQNLYGTKVSLPLLMSSKVTVRDIAEAVELRNAASADTGSVSALKEAATLLEDILKDEEIKKALYRPVVHSGNGSGSIRVFLTGSTGYLGPEILRQLLQMSNVEVVLLVRASGPNEALQRVIQKASKDGWWSEHYRSRIEAWPGDLSKPRFGLTLAQFDSLSGKNSLAAARNVNVIIQNAAKVHYNLDYDTMRSTNVSSTQDLVKLGALSKHLSNLVYVSGGQQIRPGEDNDVEMSKHAEATGGYEQSKLVAELVVKRFSNELQTRHQDFSVVKPGYIIGNAQSGLGNPDDFIWRLVQGCLEIGAYNADEQDHWVFISDKDRLAHQIVSAAFRDPTLGSQYHQGNVIKALAGMQIRDFWAVLHDDFGYNLQPLPYKEWLVRIRSVIMNRLEAHPLYPVIHILERGSSVIGCPEIPQSPGKSMIPAFRKNIEHLIEIGTLPLPATQVRQAMSNMSVASNQTDEDDEASYENLAGA